MGEELAHYKLPTQSSWRRALPDAAIVALAVLALFYYWFAVADRYAIFLYGHSAPNVPLAQPFDDVTSSRYWMAGLVAAGIIMLLYIACNWLLGLLGRGRICPAAWPQVWALSALPIAIGVPWIIMTMNMPTLPARLAAACLVAVLLGLAVALMPGRWAAERPWALLWLAADGLGLLPPLLLLHVVELTNNAVAANRFAIAMLVGVAVVGGAVWLAVLSALRPWTLAGIPGPAAVLAAGLAVSYLLLPVLHYLLFTPPGYRYISASSNFIAANPALQALALLVAGSLALGVTAARRRWSRRQPD